jgi:hypothetical protein
MTIRRNDLGFTILGLGFLVPSCKVLHSWNFGFKDVGFQNVWFRAPRRKDFGLHDLGFWVFKFQQF